MWIKVFTEHIQPGFSLVERLSLPGDFSDEMKKKYEETRAELNEWSKHASESIRKLVKAVSHLSPSFAVHTLVKFHLTIMKK